MMTAKLPFATIGLCSVLILTGCGKTAPAGAELAQNGAVPRPEATSGARRSPVLTKEEVGAVIGQPVTSVEGEGPTLTYKTAVIALETNIEVEREDGAEAAVQSMQGVQTATRMLGGNAEVVPNMGDEALFGAMSVLYVRKGDTFITITPPNMQLLASMDAAEKVRTTKLGSEEERQAMAHLQEVERTDPINASLQGGNDVQGALAVINSSSKKQGTGYEAQSRAMALALAAKIVAKL
jgi:hypothetical protein